MLRNMANSLLTHETIVTTLPKAKELRRVVEPFDYIKNLPWQTVVWHLTALVIVMLWLNCLMNWVYALLPEMVAMFACSSMVSEKAIMPR